MQCFPMGGKPQRHRAKTTAKTCWPEDSRDAEKLCLSFSFSYLHNREEKPEQKTTHQIPANRISSLLFSLSRVFCDTLFWKKRMVDWNSLSLLRKHESTLHSYAPHFPTSRPRVRQKSSSLKHAYPQILPPIERQPLLLPYFTKKKSWIHSVAVCIRALNIKTCYFESQKIAKS